ncbi:MAG: hypothetical protein HRK26_00035 [Rickettsiaceae bacterium H1]|nr:hypothetical protein [Rickettsiaceae bacterium H1]
MPERYRQEVEAAISSNFDDLKTTSNQQDLQDEIKKIKKIITEPNSESEKYKIFQQAFADPNILKIRIDNGRNQITKGKIRKCMIETIDDFLLKNDDGSERQDRNREEWNKEQLIQEFQTLMITTNHSTTLLKYKMKLIWSTSSEIFFKNFMVISKESILYFHLLKNYF